MLIHPYTLSQAAELLLVLFLISYLYVAVKNSPGDRHDHTRWMMQAMAWGGASILTTMLLGIFKNYYFNGVTYLRETINILFWHALIQSIYALPPTEPFAHRREPQIVARIAIVLLVIEVGISIFQLRNYLQTGEHQYKTLLMTFPVHSMGIGVLVVTWRKLWRVESTRTDATTEYPRLAQLRRACLAPQTFFGRLYRGVLVASMIIVCTFLIYTLSARFLVSPPIWFSIFLDITVTAAILITLFAYLSSPLAPTGLEIRVMGAGLTIFLWLISVLGWVIALTYLSQQAPGARPTEVFGSQFLVQFYETPAQYQALERMVSHLLTPLLWFAVLGASFFCGVYLVYYRSTLKSALGQIIHGFQQVQQGNLSYRLPSIAWNDEFSHIVTAFNQMAASLAQRTNELYTYQGDLQKLVDARTSQLRHEMELRKRLELHQGIQDERTRIAQEAHDGLLQSLMGVRIRLNRGKRLSKMEAAFIESELQELTGEVTQSVQDLRNLVNELNEEILPDGLISALQQLAERQQRAYPITIATDFQYTPGLLTLNEELHIMRVVQEALSNAVRHGEATELSIVTRLEPQDEHGQMLTLHIQDNGSGFDMENLHSTGWGLKNMHHRAAQLGATLHLQSEAGKGSIIELRKMLA